MPTAPAQDEGEVEDYRRGLAIGTWLLLPEIRQAVARWLADRSKAVLSDEEWAQELPALIKASLTRWSRLYTDRDYLASLAEVTGTPSPSVDAYTHLLDYLARVEREAASLDRAALIDKLLVPYLLTTSRLGQIGWWFPPQSFLDGPVQARPYPFFEKSIFTLLGSGSNATGAVQAVEKNRSFARFGQGMRALQTKVVADYDLLDVPSKTVDRLVGNGAAILQVIRDRSKEVVGILCIASPVIGLFHLLLTPRPSGNTSRSPFNSVLLCRADLTEEEAEIAENVPAPGGLQIRFCPHCKVKQPLTPACPLVGFREVVEPLIGPYLSALTRTQRDEDLRRQARLVHDLRLRSVSLFSALEAAARRGKATPDELEFLTDRARDVYHCVKHHPHLDDVSAGAGGNADLVRAIKRAHDFHRASFGLDIERTTLGQERQVFGRQGHWSQLLHDTLKNAVDAQLKVKSQRRGEELPPVAIEADLRDPRVVVVEISNMAVAWDAQMTAGLEDGLKNARFKGAADGRTGLESASIYIGLLRIVPSVRSEKMGNLWRVTVSLRQEEEA